MCSSELALQGNRACLFSSLQYFFGQEYPQKLDLQKFKTHKLYIRDGMADIYGSHENVPKTLIVPDRFALMQHPDGSFLPGLHVFCICVCVCV